MSGCANQASARGRLGGVLGAKMLRSTRRREFTGIQRLREGDHQEQSDAGGSTPRQEPLVCGRSRLRFVIKTELDGKQTQFRSKCITIPPTKYYHYLGRYIAKASLIEVGDGDRTRTRASSLPSRRAANCDAGHIAHLKFDARIEFASQNRAPQEFQRGYRPAL